MRARIITRPCPTSSCPRAALPHSPGAYIAIVLVGFAIGTLGHLFKVRWLVGIGIALIVARRAAPALRRGHPLEPKRARPGEKRSKADSPNERDSRL